MLSLMHSASSGIQGAGARNDYLDTARALFELLAQRLLLQDFAGAEIRSPLPQLARNARVPRRSKSFGVLRSLEPHGGFRGAVAAWAILERARPLAK